MPDVIQFNCPACDTALSLPLAMAAVEGPCPCCNKEIIAPDPERGLDAREVAEQAIPEFPQPPAPATEASADDAEPVVVPEENTTASPEARESPKVSSSHTAILMLSILLTATVCSIAGFLLGARSIKTPAAESPFAPTPVTVITTSNETPDEVPVIQPPAPATTEPEKVTEPVKASAAAEAALKAFLDAPDWAARSAYVLDSGKLGDAMEAYSHIAPDGPTSYTSISIQNSYTDKITGNTLFIYQVITGRHPEGFPVAVSETSGGWLVDWQAFVEFRDDLFIALADGPAGESGTFHLLVTAPPAKRAEDTENAHFSSFVIEAPLPDRQRLAYARKSSKIHASLTAATANGSVFTPILEVAKRKTPDDRTFLEITDIQATDWLPESW